MSCSRRHTVAPGESLWTISGRVLATRAAARIARFWPRLYRANRGLIGPDPHLIRPGQVLRLPGGCDR
jgi:nucleoid-associated protein YgaU